MIEIFLRVFGVHAEYTERNQSKTQQIISPRYHSYYTAGAYISEDGIPTYVPNRSMSMNQEEFSWELVANSEGFPDREWVMEKKKAYRYFCGGDSFTEGIGGSGDFSYPQILERISENVEVFNFGVSGSDPFFMFAALKKRVRKYHPDLVTVTINSTDISDVILKGGFERFQSDGTIAFRSPPWWEEIYAHSFLFRLIIHGISEREWNLLKTEDIPLEEEIAIEKLKGCMDSIHYWCTEQGIRCAFIFHPFAGEALEKKFETQEMIDYGLKNDYEVVVIDTFMKMKSIDTYYWPIDCHHTPCGYAAFAEELKRELCLF